MKGGGGCWRGHGQSLSELKSVVAAGAIVLFFLSFSLSFLLARRHTTGTHWATAAGQLVERRTLSHSLCLSDEILALWTWGALTYLPEKSPRLPSPPSLFILFLFFQGDSSERMSSRILLCCTHRWSFSLTPTDWLTDWRLFADFSSGLEKIAWQQQQVLLLFF